MIMSFVLPLLTLIGLTSYRYAPTTWREPETRYTMAERMISSHQTISSLFPGLNETIGYFNDLSYWQSANVFSVMAIKDDITPPLYQDIVTTYLNRAFSLYPDYSTQYNDDALWWATAAYYAYRAYGDTNLLNHAVQTWEHIKTFQISPEDAQTGSIPTKSLPIMSTCDGQTMAGGVFWRPIANDTAVNSVTTGLFLTLSAYLAEATGNSTYTDAAVAAATWMQTLNMNSDNLALDTIDANDCSRSPATVLFTYNSGKLIEGLSVLSDVLGPQGQDWHSFMLEVSYATMYTTVWQGENGVITEGGVMDVDDDIVGFKSVLIRGLREAYIRNPDEGNLREVISSYFNVQLNALMELSSTYNIESGTWWFSAEWAGPKPTNFTAWGQLAALDALVSSISTI